MGLDPWGLGGNGRSKHQKKGLYQVGSVGLITPLQSEDPFSQGLSFLPGLVQQFRKLCFALWEKKKSKVK